FDSNVLPAQHQQLTVLSRGNRGGCGSPETAAGKGRAGRVDSSRDQAEGWQTRGSGRRCECRPDAADGRPEGREGSADFRGPRIYQEWSAAISRAGQPGDCRGREGSAGRWREPECQSGRRVDTASSGSAGQTGSDDPDSGRGGREARRGQ